MTRTQTTAAATREQAWVEALRATVTGDVIDRSDTRYDEVRRVWNGVIDRYPAAIARCADTADVVAALGVVRAHRPPVSIRGGGHQVAGSAVCDDGLVLDLSAMTGVHVDAHTRTARVGAGARWADLNRATQRYGLVTPGGEVSETGVAGLTLGGGLGALQRAFGLSCDNLRSVEIVTADGTVRTASREHHPDLFWAIRGGGRGLGVVTEFEFDLYPLGPQVASALVFYPYPDAQAVLAAWRTLVDRLPDTVSPEFALWSVPPDPEIPAEMHGTRVVLVAGLHAGDAQEGLAVLAPLARLGTPLMDATGIVDYTASQSELDALFPAGGRYYFTSHFLDDVDDAAAAALIAADADRPNPESLIIIRTLGGAVARVGDEDSAFAHRRARFNVSFDAGWSDPVLDGTAIGWARSGWAALRPFATGGVYVNFAGLGEDTDHAAVYGGHAARLAEIQRTYDPDRILVEAAGRP